MKVRREEDLKIKQNITNSKSTKIGNEMTKNRESLLSRIKDIILTKKKNLKELRIKMESDRVEKELEPCTFTPSINNNSSHKRRTIGDLYKWNLDKKKRLLEKEFQIEIEKKKKLKPFHPNKNSSKMIKNDQSSKVEDRLIEYTKKKKEKVEAIAESLTEGLFKPTRLKNKGIDQIRNEAVDRVFLHPTEIIEGLCKSKNDDINSLKSKKFYTPKKDISKKKSIEYYSKYSKERSSHGKRIVYEYDKKTGLRVPAFSERNFISKEFVGNKVKPKKKNIRRMKHSQKDVVVKENKKIEKEIEIEPIIMDIDEELSEDSLSEYEEIEGMKTNDNELNIIQTPKKLKQEEYDDNIPENYVKIEPSKKINDYSNSTLISKKFKEIKNNVLPHEEIRETPKNKEKYPNSSSPPKYKNKKKLEIKERDSEFPFPFNGSISPIRMETDKKETENSKVENKEKEGNNSEKLKLLQNDRKMRNGKFLTPTKRSYFSDIARNTSSKRKEIKKFEYDDIQAYQNYFNEDYDPQEQIRKLKERAVKSRDKRMRKQVDNVFKRDKQKIRKENNGKLEKDINKESYGLIYSNRGKVKNNGLKVNVGYYSYHD